MSLLFFGVEKQLIIIKQWLLHNSSIPLGTHHMIRRKVDLPQSYITEKSAEYSDLIREKKQIRGPLWPDHNSRDVKIEFTKHSQKLTYTCRVSQTQNTFFVLILNLTYYMLMHHSQKNYKKQLRTRLRPVYSYHVTMVDASFSSL